MIKRLKWNVLYGDEDDGQQTDGSDGSTGSEDSAKAGAEAAQKVLDALVQNDPDLSGAPNQSQDEGESARSEDEGKNLSETKNRDHEEDDSETGAGSEEDVQDMQGGAGKRKRAEWRECAMCPGRRFLNDEDVQKHLSSGGHMKRAAKANKKAEGKEETQAVVDNSEAMRAEKRKKKAKQKLQALQNRNRERRQQKTESKRETDSEEEGKQPSKGVGEGVCNEQTPRALKKFKPQNAQNKAKCSEQSKSPTLAQRNYGEAEHW